ncbi:hypothetical protein D5F01_LYC17165 [Larimichthys crocea]|uniref:Uncharacterized protein n=1 Tax=Larimichthys crocea TaxID=215358 RepID=A0A6G0HX82_LARCR|nr:hypothetical protein D5F01_LYC17165 [Larimichthys crocea]
MTSLFTVDVCKQHDRSLSRPHTVIPADVQQVLRVKEEVPPDWTSSLDQENPEPLHIKNEQEELWISHQGEQLNGLEEADINRFPFSAASVKSEDDEEKPQLSLLHQSQTEDNRDGEPRASSSAMEVKTESDAEDCGGSEPARNPDPDNHSQPNPDEADSDSSETDVSDDESDAEDCGGTEPARNPDPDNHSQPNTDEKDSDSSDTDISEEQWYGCLSDSEPEDSDGGWKETMAPEFGVNTRGLFRDT